ncbi:MAG: TetR/AcrR family transcriptional regulator, partial [Solirubrobacteraceae bacterium]
MSTRPDVQARHRRRRQATRQRILDATLELLQERPWHEIALEQIMARAQLTRTAFYKHFADRSGLLVACIEQLGVRLEDIPAAWERGAPDPAAALRSALDELVATDARHGRLLAAVADAAATDPGVRAAYLGLGDRLAAAAAQRIAADVAAGRSRVADPAEVA